jgi:hypothetical protein
MIDELNRLLEEKIDYILTNVHTAIPGVVEKYDHDTQRADIQPSLRRKMPGGGFADLPVVPGVPVLFTGTEDAAIRFPLKKGNGVLLLICERSIDVWMDKGGKGIEDDDIRRFSLMDAVAIPGLQAKNFKKGSGSGFEILYKGNSLNLTDDGKIELNGKTKPLVTYDELNMALQAYNANVIAAITASIGNTAPTPATLPAPDISAGRTTKVLTGG